MKSSRGAADVRGDWNIPSRRTPDIGARRPRAHDWKPRAPRAGRERRVDRSRSRGRPRPSQVVDPRSLRGGQPADEFAFGPLRARHERRDLQSPGVAPRARARGKQSCLARPFGHRDVARCLRPLGARRRRSKRSVGMFALAVWDRQSRKLLLARDRAGEKPLYYGWQRDCLLFGSELKSLRAHPAFRLPSDATASRST